MSKFFNIAGPCNPEDHYMLSATARVPDVMRLVCDKTYFVVHAQRQCGKTTAFRALVDDINASGERVAMYCTLEDIQPFTDPTQGLPRIASQIRQAVSVYPEHFGNVTTRELIDDVAGSEDSDVVKNTLRAISVRCAKPLVVFFDEVDCLAEGTLVAFLRQLRSGRIGYTRPRTFPASIALIGMRNIRDYKAQVRPDSQTLGSASPFNVITKAMTLRCFTEEEVAALYRQHTDATGQVWEPGVAALAYAYSCGQPYLVNALARWCMDEIHDRRFDEPITLDDMHEAKEKIIRERGTHVDSLMERMKEPRVRKVVEPVMLGGERTFSRTDDDFRYVIDLGLLAQGADGLLKPANPMYAEIIGRYLSRDDQDDMLQSVPETPWVRADGLDMQGLLVAFQQFWRENAGANKAPFEYNEAYPHIVLQAFLQRVLNGGGEILREMALGKGALDLGVKFRGATYPVEVKLLYNFARSPEKAYDQVARYIDHLGQTEGWLVVFDPDLTKPWEEKLATDEVVRAGKRLHVVRC